MTEFRRASSSVETLKSLAVELAELCDVPAEGTLSDETRSKYSQVQKLVADLEPTAEKMRSKCQARADLELAKAQLQELLPGPPAASSADVLKVAQELVDGEGEGAEALRPLLLRALELDGLATYGAKMVEKVQDLLSQYDAARTLLKAKVEPRLAGAVASAAAADAERQAELARAAAAAAEEQRRREEEERRRPVAQLMEENEQRLREQREAQEAAERKAAEEEKARAASELARAAEEQALRREMEEGERRLAEVGPDAACGEALVGMLAATVGSYREAVGALQAMLGAIAAEPSDARLRLVRVGNEVFQRQLGRRPGCWLFLRGVGFVPCTRDALPQALAGQLGLAAAPGSEERFLWLAEPDMMGEFEAWLSWHERLKAIAQFLQALERLAFQRCAHLGQHGNDVATMSLLPVSDVLQRWEARAC